MIGSKPSSLRLRSRGAIFAIGLGAGLQGCVLDADLGAWESDTAQNADRDASDDAAYSGPDADQAQDAGCASDAGVCTSSEGGTNRWELTVSLGPTTSYFADGRSLPAGEYTLAYLDGCWKSGVVAWTVNLGPDGYVVVGGEPEQRVITMAPGTVGTFAGLGAYGLYEDCVAANAGRAGVTFRFEGGPLGLKLESFDPLLSSFILLEGGESVGGRSPTFGLACAGSCR
jgi:hypothetical protein